MWEYSYGKMTCRPLTGAFPSLSATVWHAGHCREARERHANYPIIEAGSEEISVAIAVSSYCCGLLNDCFCKRGVSCKC